MDRRATLQTLVGNISKTNRRSGKTRATTFIAGGLDPYNGPWNFEQAAHLLRRAMFGPSYAQIKQAVSDGLVNTISKLLDTSSLPTTGPVNPGVYRRFPINDPYVPAGQSWVRKDNGVWKAKGYDISDPASVQANQVYRRLTLRTWTTERILREQVSSIEKMTLFWHNHFVTADIQEPLFEFRYITTLRENAFGNFRQLVKLMTVDPAMLFYLNGNENSNRQPNENYARELFELFAIGKGPLAGPGDYTNYTEEDIKEAAKVLTGWRVNGFRNLRMDANGELLLENSGLVTFAQNLHDTSQKRFSNRFNNATISNAGANEYNQLVDMIFQQPECAKFICRKIYRWFIYYVITPQAEVDVIEPLAQLLIDNNYEIKPVLQALFRSQHFFDALNIGPMIKNPYDFLMTMLKPFDYIAKVPAALDAQYAFFAGINGRLDGMQMTYFAPPDVAGWKPYYQEPLFYRIWINSTTLQSRMRTSTNLAMSVNDQGRPDASGLDVLKFTASIDNPMDPNSLIDEFSKILFPQPITQEQKDYLKEILLPGLPDYEWAIEYGDHLAEPDNQALRIAVESKLRNLINAMLSLSEFYLS